MTVLVAGAGPAGARLATRLAQAGEQVMLVDPLTDPLRNAYSSAAVPMRDALQLEIPDDCWSSCWNGWQLLDPEGTTLSGGLMSLLESCSISDVSGPLCGNRPAGPAST